MEESGVKFGTSGARGLAVQMTDRVCYTYTKGFLQYLDSKGDIAGGASVAIAGDFRPSTDQIMAAVGRAVADCGYTPINCGKIPSPAVALKGIADGIPAIMVTGSHIPANRNGIKFNTPSGEILKSDEDGIRAQQVALDDSLFNDDGGFVAPFVMPTVDDSAKAAYVSRYLDFFPKDALSGTTIGVYQHSAVGRDILVDIYKGLGATVTALGRSETFIPVDTEAIRAEDVALAKEWCCNEEYFTIVSTDGDSDRPLISDENGTWIRGDVAGILSARYLGADSVSTPVSCNSAVEKSGFFVKVQRTRIGSPFVIAAMNEAVKDGAQMAIGYEANGGFLTNSTLRRFGRALAALPTRDAVILQLSIILLARMENCSISALCASLPQRFTSSDRITDFPLENSRAILEKFSTGDGTSDSIAIEKKFGALCGKVATIDRTDGIRITFENQEVVHLRPSGNAPEFRCYTEAATDNRAKTLNTQCMKILQQMI
ncbi:MAG: phosphomannomutase [Deltaproteobacteria bacterium]|nr:phosphomannomutase [Deltaproteobacteria bacterium]